ncbi:MAG: aldo/keto reductase [Acidobacteria bacterium]|nr:aldo/keto reductase [Acidobacteriota bacterium]
MSISRRSFLGSTTLAGVAAAAVEKDAKSGMPTRIFGRTGARISVLAFGCGSRFLAYKDPDKACEALNRALDQGVTYVDTAYGYGNGQSEEWVGRVMKTRRKQVWLTTKIDKRKADEAQRIIEGSLKRLNTDHVDLIHVHSLTNDDDLAAVEAPDGVLKVLYKLREQKVIRAVGVTSHTDPVVLRKAIERNDFDCTQFALNAARAGMRNAPGGFVPNYMHDSFETLVLPVANRKKMGVIAMKVFAQEGLSGKATAEKLIHYSMSLPVSAVVVGMPKFEFVDENIAIAKRFTPMPRNEMKRLSDELSTEHKARLDAWFHNHVDC